MSAKPAKSGAKEEEASAAPPKKNKTKLMILIAVAVLVLGGGGAGAYFMLKPAKSAKADGGGDHGADEGSDGGEEDGGGDVKDDKHPPKFVDLGTFTTNLAEENGEHVVQVVMSVKITKPELEEKIKGRAPEISHHINMILQSKRPSDISNAEGKKNMAQEIKEQIEYILGLRKTAPVIQTGANKSEEGAVDEHGKPVKKKESKKKKTPVAEVLFTSFLIQ